LLLGCPGTFRITLQVEEEFLNSSGTDRNQKNSKNQGGNGNDGDNG
jgi:hypothetical protein